MKCHLLVPVCQCFLLEVLLEPGGCLHWQCMCTVHIPSFSMHFVLLAWKKKNKASFLLLSYSLVIWAPDEFLLSNWDQILQGCRNTYFVFSFFCFSIFIFRLCRGFFPSMFICLGETGDLCDRKEWKIEKFLASRRPFLIHLISSLLLSV